MLVADRLYWFKRDCGHTCDTSTLDSAVAYLSRIIADTHKDIIRIGEPDDGYEQMVYDDLVDLHNRAVDLFNALIERGL